MKHKQKFVSDIKQGDNEIDDLFIVVKKDMLSKKDNSRYIGMLLRDRTGTIEGRIWDKVDMFNDRFKKNDLVRVQAFVDQFQGKFQLNIKDIAREDPSEEDLKAFYPEGTTDHEELTASYYRVVDRIENPSIKALFDVFHANKDLLNRYFIYPASIGVHHVYFGGLLEHSACLARMGLEIASIVNCDKDLVIAGSLLHDIGKIDEIVDVKGIFEYSDKGRLLGHITLGVMILEELIRNTEGFPPETGDILKHIIISHHGIEEWGSPRKPMFPEALIVHYLDNLDAKVMGVREHMKENMEDDRWSKFHRLYESRFYKLPER